MSLLNKYLIRILTHKVKYSVASSNKSFSFQYKSCFTEEEQTKILNTINESDAEQLSRFQVSQFRIKNIESWKNKKGPFKSLDEVLEVEGLGEKLLQKLCTDIVNNNQLNPNKNNVKLKKIKQLITPVININMLNSFSNAVGIHLSSTGISWAKLSKLDNKLTDWDFEDFSSLPKRMLPDETFMQSIDIIKKVPSSDLYIFETHPVVSPQSQTQTSAISAYAQQLELNAMLFALLNTSVHHNITLKANKNDLLPKIIENRVFYLKSRTPAKLFSTLVGQERVSAISVIDKLLNKDLSMPCTPITFDEKVKNVFNTQSSANKELLGQALILIISFMDLCVYKNPISLTAISNKSRK